MKIMTILGTRPEIVRLSLILPLLDQHSDHCLVHTGQNYDPRLSDIFFDDLGLRRPDVQLQLEGSGFGAQVGSLLSQIEPVLLRFRPDRILLLGDTNSGLVAIAARRLGIPVYHMEAGNRCFDDRVPEEVNRRVIDHSSSILLPYTENSRANLIAEGIEPRRIYVTGNPISEVLEHFSSRIEQSGILGTLGLSLGKYFLVTLHRSENVDVEARLRNFLTALETLRGEYGIPVVFSLHPRTRSRIEQFGLRPEGLVFNPPFSFFDFVKLEQNASCVLSDSGTVQEECAIFGVPNVTLRDATERPETLETGSSALSGADPDRIRTLVRLVTARREKWAVPSEYLRKNVSDIVIRILLAYRPPDAAESAWRGES